MPTLSDTPSTSDFLSFISLLLNSEIIRQLFSGVIDFWKASRFRGTYRVEHHQVTLDLRDASGRTAIYTKRQQVMYLQDNVFAIQDQAWGDGNIFAGYRCSPGVAVDRYKEGYRWKILISLRGTRNRGETDDFTIERMIMDGFVKPIGNFQTQIDHPTKELTIGVIFPAHRYPKSVTLIEQNRKRTHKAAQENTSLLPQGRIQYQWHMIKPRLYESYILRWEW